VEGCLPRCLIYKRKEGIMLIDTPFSINIV
jgi:hypothetical protein